MCALRQGLRKGHWSQLRFHGDEMLRPAASNEVAWLAVVLVRLSMWLNQALGLDRAPDEDAHPDNIFQVRAAAATCCSVSHCSFHILRRLCVHATMRRVHLLFWAHGSCSSSPARHLLTI